MRWTFRSLLAAVSLSMATAMLGGTCLAHGYRIGSLEIVHPAIVMPKSGSNPTCAYMTIVNHGTSVERLVGLLTSIAEVAYLTKLDRDGGYREAPEGVAILPGEKVNLRKAVWCLLLSGLKVELEADAGAYTGSLIFEKAGVIEIEFMCDGPDRRMS